MADSIEILQYIHSKSTGKIAEYPWFEQVLRENRLKCYFQPIVDANKTPVAYESFVRAELSDGTMASGGVIMQAGVALHIEHALDKHLHKQAIEEFTKHKLQGMLCINFVSGFVQLPAKYLDGLSKAAEDCGLLPGKLALDVSNAEDVQNLEQLAAIAEFCYNLGYQLALDDISNPAALEEILNRFNADFVKIDRQVLEKPKIVREIIKTAHSHSCKVIIEGVETEDVFQKFAQMGADYFQGYFFSKPLAAEEIAKQV